MQSGVVVFDFHFINGKGRNFFDHQSADSIGEYFIASFKYKGQLFVFLIVFQFVEFHGRWYFSSMMAYTRLPLLPPFMRQPLCGSGVTSSILPIRNPVLAKARIAG